MKRIKTIGNALFWITLISPVISFSIASTVGEASIFGVAGIIRYSWVMWLFIPLGVLSILIGEKLKKCKQRYKKNYIVGLVCVPLLIILGSYRFIFNNISYDVSKVAAVERITKIDLPNQVKIATNKFESYEVSYLKVINKDEKKVFEDELNISSQWTTQLSSKLKSLLPFDVQYELENFDRFVFYNTTKNEYNIYPSDGEGHCIFVAYDYETQRLIILDDLRINLN